MSQHQRTPEVEVVVPLCVAEAMAAQSRTEAEELLTILAHDLRNHITPLQGRLDLIRRRALREQRPEYLNDTEHAVKTLERLRQLIADLLDVSRLDRGLFRVEARPVDIAALVRETADAFMSSDVPIELLMPDKFIAPVDAKRFQQALENLLANAVSHSPVDGVVRVEVTTATGDALALVEVRVTDQGTGIPLELMPHLFDRFSVGPGSVGLGLGLYLANQIAIAHGGTLRVDSPPGQGASFVLAVPALLLEAQLHAAIPLRSCAG
jgi:signal transduction histidine kinase